LDCIDVASARSTNAMAARAPEPAMAPPLLELASVAEIDEAMLGKLIGGDTALLRELVRTYFETSPGLLEQIDRALAEGNAKQLRNAAHALKGAISNFAAVPAMQACATLERIGASGVLADAASARQELAKHLGSFHAKLSTLVAAQAARA
jgi:HPt (histidine-containing phosphotransfer) domain-containing protein